MAQRVFAQKHLPDDPLFKLVSLFYEVVPPVLTAGGKVRRPESHIHSCSCRCRGQPDAAEPSGGPLPPQDEASLQLAC